MAGGIGSRFWPFSRYKEPKQFLDILGTGKTLIQQTIERFEGIVPINQIFIVTNADYYSLVKEQIPEIRDEQILLEPVGRNTAPCIAYGVAKISKKNPQASIIVSPSDHVILKQEEFRKTIDIALDHIITNDSLLTLGIQPSRPDTGYGYIQFIESADEIKKVKTFTEKPNLELAQTFLESGDFLWNSGMFIWKADVIEKALKAYLPDIGELFFSDMSHYYKESEPSFIQNNYARSKSISIDYGVMEKASNVFVLPSNFGWSDLGTWKSLYETKEKDESQNLVDGKVMLSSTTNCVIKSDKDKLLVVHGLDNFIVVQHEDVVMICKKDEEQEVKNFVTDIKQQKDLSKFA